MSSNKKQEEILANVICETVVRNFAINIIKCLLLLDISKFFPYSYIN